MGNLESTPEQHKSIHCSSTEKSIPDLKKDGWEYEWSFHTNSADQWNDACDKVEALQHDSDWKAVLVQGQDEAERKDSVAYIYKKKTPQRIEWDKEQGY